MVREVRNLFKELGIIGQPPQSHLEPANIPAAPTNTASAPPRPPLAQNLVPPP